MVATANYVGSLDARRTSMNGEPTAPPPREPSRASAVMSLGCDWVANLSLLPMLSLVTLGVTLCTSAGETAVHSAAILGLFWATPILRVPLGPRWTSVELHQRTLLFRSASRTLEIPLERITALELWLGGKKPTLLRLHHTHVPGGAVNVAEAGAVAFQEAERFCALVGERAPSSQTFSLSNELAPALRSALLAAAATTPGLLFVGPSSILFTVVLFASTSAVSLLVRITHAGARLPVSQPLPSVRAWCLGQARGRATGGYR